MNLTSGSNWQDHLGSQRRQLDRFAEQTKSLRVAGWWNVGRVNDIHGVTMRPGEHGDNPAC